jgi:hypothetical protein
VTAADAVIVARAGESSATGTAGGSGPAISFQGAPYTVTGTTSSSSATVQVHGADVRREVTVTATLQSDSSKTATATVRFGAELPSGFLALYNPASYPNKNWSDAGAFCTSQGGHLPRIQGSTGLAAPAVTSGDAVEGFGTLNGTWPPGLPFNVYWTGAEATDYTGFSWIVFVSGGVVGWHYDNQTFGNRIVCVP